jgi:hypothetical protein
MNSNGPNQAYGEGTPQNQMMMMSLHAVQGGKSEEAMPKSNSRPTSVTPKIRSSQPTPVSNWYPASQQPQQQIYQQRTHSITSSDLCRSRISATIRSDFDEQWILSSAAATAAGRNAEWATRYVPQLSLHVIRTFEKG